MSQGDAGALGPRTRSRNGTMNPDFIYEQPRKSKACERRESRDSPQRVTGCHSISDLPVSLSLSPCLSVCLSNRPHFGLVCLQAPDLGRKQHRDQLCGPLPSLLSRPCHQRPCFHPRLLEVSTPGVLGVLPYHISLSCPRPMSLSVSLSNHPFGLMRLQVTLSLVWGPMEWPWTIRARLH
jgi:hypothetical protein